MKEKISHKNIGKLLLIILFPLLLELFFSNIHLISNKVRQKIEPIDYADISLKNFTLEEDKLVAKKEKAQLVIKVPKKYIQKLQLNYTSPSNVGVKFVIEGYSKNKQKFKTTLTSNYSKYNNLISKNINEKITKITITTDCKDVSFSNIQINNKGYFNWNRYFLFLMLTISTIIIVQYRKKEDHKLYQLYIALSFLAGLTLIYCLPNIATITWDEAIHYNNTNEILKGKTAEIKESDIILTDNSISYPSSYEESKNLSGTINQYNTIAAYKLIGTNIIPYAKFVYTPSAIFTRIGDLLRLSPTILFKLGKLINLIIYIALFAYAIKICKFGKRTLFVLGLIPLSLFQATTYSADSLIIAAITLSMTEFINIIVDKKSKMNLKSALTFILPLLAACFAKAVYCPLLLLVLFLPNDKFRNKKTSYAFKGLIFCLFLLMMSTFGLGMLTNASNMGDSRGGHTNFAEQMRVILHDPLGFINICLINITTTFAKLLSGKNEGLIFFAYLGGSEYNIAYIVVFLLFFTVFTNNNEKNKCEISLPYKILILILNLGIIFGISLALYLSFTEVGAAEIAGVQSRYYVPLLYPLLIILSSSKIYSNFKTKSLNFWISIISNSVIYIAIFELILYKLCW